MTSITFYGGIKEIGGNKFLVEDKGTKNFMDLSFLFVLVKLFTKFEIIDFIYYMIVDET